MPEEQMRVIRDLIIRGVLRNEQEVSQYIIDQGWIAPGVQPLARQAVAEALARHTMQNVAPYSNLQEEIFGTQPMRDVFLRGSQNAFGSPVSNFSPIGQDALSTAFGRFQDINPITNFFPQQEMGVGFTDFLNSPRPTPASLGTSLENILNAVRPSFGGSGTGVPNEAANTTFQAQFGDPNAALGASMQPFLGSLAPRLRGSAGQSLRNRFGTQFAANPTGYTTPDQIFRFMDKFNQDFNQGF